MSNVPSALLAFRLIQKQPPRRYATDLKEAGVPDNLIEDLYAAHSKAYRLIAEAELAINYSIISHFMVWISEPSDGRSKPGQGAWRLFIARIRALEQELESQEPKADMLGALLNEWVKLNKR